MLHATAGIVRCGGFYAAVGMFRIRAAILQEHFARGYSDVVPHAAALKGCSFPNNQTPRTVFRPYRGVFHAACGNSIFIFVEQKILF